MGNGKVFGFLPSPARKVPIQTLVMIHSKLLVLSCLSFAAWVGSRSEGRSAKSWCEVFWSNGLYSSKECVVGGGHEMLCASTRGLEGAITEDGLEGIGADSSGGAE